MGNTKQLSKIRQYLPMLRCPVSGQLLRLKNEALVSEDGLHRYPISESGIPLFADEILSAEGKIQRAHYSRIAKEYVENLSYPHTQQYTDYLDQALLDVVDQANLDIIAEICCGRGEAFHLLKGRFGSGIGVDVSEVMLEAGQMMLSKPNIFLVQGDATMLPLAEGVFDSVILLGGVHHINDRNALYKGIYGILKPGGSLIWREPVNDFFLWRWLREIVYRLSPTLNYGTERPLLYRETISHLQAAGFEPKIWRTYGFVGFMLLMNSDVLVVNRLLRFVPGIEWITKGMVRLDDWAISLPFLRNAGLQVIGMAKKPAQLM